MNRSDHNHNTVVLLAVILTGIICFGLGALIFGLEILRNF
jgi:hypothetical protein